MPEYFFDVNCPDCPPSGLCEACSAMADRLILLELGRELHRLAVGYPDLNLVVDGIKKTTDFQGAMRTKVNTLATKIAFFETLVEELITEISDVLSIDIERECIDDWNQGSQDV